MVASAVYRAGTSGIVVPDFVSSDGGYLGNPVVHPHEVGIFSELGGDFARANPLACRAIVVIDMRHCSGVVWAGNLIQSLVEITDRESLSETSMSFVPLSVAVTSSVFCRRWSHREVRWQIAYHLRCRQGTGRVNSPKSRRRRPP
jgi:hypothetical protein